MALETGTYISDLVVTNPTSSDPKSAGDDHLRLLKATIKASFPAVTGAVTSSHTELNLLDGKTDVATAADISAAAFVAALPTVAGNAGKLITNDGATAGWNFLTSAQLNAAISDADIAVLAANTFTGAQTFPASGVKLTGSSTGVTTFASANAGATNYTFTLPAVNATAAILGAQTFTSTQTFPASGIQLTGSSTGVTTLISDNAGATNYAIHLPASNDTLATLAGAQTLSNKTFTAPILGTPASGIGTNITGVNAATLGGATFAQPGPIGGTTPAAVAATALTATSLDGVTIDTTTNKPVTAASLAGGTLPGSFTALGLSGTITSTHDGVITTRSGASTNAQYTYISSTGGELIVGIEAGTPSLVSGTAGYDALLRSSTPISFSANSGNNVQMRLTAAGLAVTGALSATGTGQVGTTLAVGGATPSASGAGVTFPATQSASSNANTLDDYEEGTWTPNQGSGLTVVGAFSSSGKYTKVGSIVHIFGLVQGATSVAAAGNGVICTNLPFIDTGFIAVGSGFGANVSSSSTIIANVTNINCGTAIAAALNIQFSITITT